MLNSYNFLRFTLVLSSFSPVFLIWLIQRNEVPFNRIWFDIICSMLVLLPNLVLGLRMSIAKKSLTRISVGNADDRRQDIVGYLLAMLLPFYSLDISTGPRFLAITAALAMIIFLFWKLHMHHLNVVFALFGYRIFSVSPPKTENPYSSTQAYTILTRREMLPVGDTINAYLISNNVYLVI